MLISTQRAICAVFFCLYIIMLLLMGISSWLYYVWALYVDVVFFFLISSLVSSVAMEGAHLNIDISKFSVGQKISYHFES